MRITLCVVFDDDTDVLPTRARLADQALGELARKGILELEGDVVAVRTRRDFLDRIRGSQDCLAIADMHGRRSHAGNIGARMLRAISEHDVCATTTRRVLWTRHDHPEIERDMGPYAHAIAHFAATDHRPLVAAVEHIARAQPGAPLQTFPPVRDVVSWEHELRRRLEWLTDNDVKPGDERIALEVYHRVPDNLINTTLDRAADIPHRVNVNKLLHTIVDAGRASSVGDARELLIEEVGPVAQERATDQLHPEVVVDADKSLTLLRDYDADERRALTWLSERLERVARRFITSYNEAPKKTGRKESPGLAFRAVDIALTDPAYVQLKGELELTDSDLTYALWTLSDTRKSLLAEAGD